MRYKMMLSIVRKDLNSQINQSFLYNFLMGGKINIFIYTADSML